MKRDAGVDCSVTHHWDGDNREGRAEGLGQRRSSGLVRSLRDTHEHVPPWNRITFRR